MIIKIKIPEDFFKNLSDAYNEVNAMKSVISESCATGNPILPSDSYHKAYVESYKRYQQITNQIVPVLCPEFEGSDATWVVDFENQLLVIDLLDPDSVSHDTIKFARGASDILSVEN